jgi:hypothetical protein
MARLLTQAQFARKANYSRARITQLVKQRVIVLRNGKVDPAQANAAIEANIDRSRRVRSESAMARTKSRSAKTKRENPQLELMPTGFNTDHEKSTGARGFNTDHETGISSLTEARRQHEEIKMELSKLKLEIEKGNLVPKDQAIEWLSLMVNNAKLRLLGIPKRMAGPLAIILDEKEIEYRLRMEIRRILEELGTPLKGKKKNATSTTHSA